MTRLTRVIIVLLAALVVLPLVAVWYWAINDMASEVGAAWFVTWTVLFTVTIVLMYVDTPRSAPSVPKYVNKDWKQSEQERIDKLRQKLDQDIAAQRALIRKLDE